MPPLATQGICSRATPGRSDAVGSYLTLEAGARSGKRVARDVLIHVNSLRMLSQIIEARKAPRAVALKGPFSGMFSGRLLGREIRPGQADHLPNVSSQVLTSCEAELTGRKVGTEEALSFLLL